MLATTFQNLLSKYSKDITQINEFWLEIEQNYTGQNRFYHNLTHLQNMLDELSEVKPMIQDWDSVLISLFYHDTIYDAQRTDNEEQSAKLMQERLSNTSFDKISVCQAQILATKSHQVSTKHDTNLFLDADLSILGYDWEKYLIYTQQIRQEYAFYPEDLYKVGRANVMEKFLAMPQIYKTPHFIDKYESIARANIKREIEILKS